MKRGKRPTPNDLRKRRGTFRPSRHDGTIEVGTTDAPPRKPSWLTEAGANVWNADLRRVRPLATELDSTMFATYCNLQGAITLAWRAGDVPPTSYVAELRRMAEQFGIAGDASRDSLPGADQPVLRDNVFKALFSRSRKPGDDDAE